jgi:hypothetical protein|tara:strand:- start:322 stop:936 length:615 start_codon:yes stop_codon:yes gene_type:complete
MKRLWLILFVISSVWGQDEINQYFDIYPSSKGDNYTKLRHNVYGFSIDIPFDWTFRIVGNFPNDELIFFPEKMNLRVMSKEYENIMIANISMIPELEGLSLEQACKATMVGKEKVYTGANKKYRISKLTQVKINDYEGYYYEFEIDSDTNPNLKVLEQLHFIKKGNEYRTITIRGEKLFIKSKSKFYNNILNTFKIFEPTIVLE